MIDALGPGEQVMRIRKKREYGITNRYGVLNSLLHISVLFSSVGLGLCVVLYGMVRITFDLRGGTASRVTLVLKTTCCCCRRLSFEKNHILSSGSEWEEESLQNGSATRTYTLDRS